MPTDRFRMARIYPGHNGPPRVITSFQSSCEIGLIVVWNPKLSVGVAALLHCITLLWKVPISLHKQAMQRFHMNISVCTYFKSCNISEYEIYVPRVEVNAEFLGKWDPTWPCSSCMGQGVLKNHFFLALLSSVGLGIMFSLVSASKKTGLLALFAFES